jgi:spermidine synthase
VPSSFGDEFYELVKAALKPNGSLAAQGESMPLRVACCILCVVSYAFI